MTDVLFEVQGGVGRITLNRPRAINALTTAMLADIGEQLSAWRDEPSVERARLTGAAGKVQDGGELAQRAIAQHSAEHRLAQRTGARATVMPVPFMAKIIHMFMNMDRMVGGQFQQGLVSMKAVAEK